MRRGPGIDRDRRIYEKTQRSVEDNIRTDDDTGVAVVHPGDDTLRRVHDTGQADIGFQLHVWFSGRHHTDVSVECKAEQQLQADVDNIHTGCSGGRRYILHIYQATAGHQVHIQEGPGAGGGREAVFASRQGHDGKGL